MDTKMLRWTLEDKLVKARNAAGLTQAEMAARLSVGLRTVQRWENATTPISRPALMAWSMATGAPIEWLEDDGEVDVMASDTHRYLTEWLLNGQETFDFASVENLSPAA